MAQPETTELLLQEHSKSAQFQEEERGTGSCHVQTYLYMTTYNVIVTAPGPSRKREGRHVVVELCCMWQTAF